MQSHSQPNSPKVTMLKSFRSTGGRLFAANHESERDLLSPPSSSCPPKKRPHVLYNPLRELSPSHTFNLRLIELIKQRRALYDGTTPGGRSSSFRLQMWDGLAMQLEYDKGGFSLQKRWKQIRDKYVKERRLLADSAARAPHQRKTSSWPLYNQLAFLDPHLVEKQERSMSPTPSQIPYWSSTRPRGGLSTMEVEDFNRRVIAAVRAQPVLYSKTEPRYHSTEQRMAAWHAVLTDLNFPCDASEIQRYWKSIRDRYIRIRRSLHDPSDSSSPSSQSSRQQQRPRIKWAHYHELQWLEPFLEMRQRAREESALSRQAADRIRRGLVALADEDHGVVVDYEVDAESVEASLLFSAQTELLESGVRFDGDTAFAASVIADIRALPDDVQAEVRARIEMVLEDPPVSVQQLQQLQQMHQIHSLKRRRSVSVTPALSEECSQMEEGGMGMVKEEREEGIGLRV